MTDPITMLDLPVATSVDPTEDYMWIVQGGTDKRVLIQDVTGADSGGSGTPGGANTQVQYNNNGDFGGSTTLTWIAPTLTIGLAGTGTGALALAGTTSGTVMITVAAAAGTWSLTLPTNDGDAGQALITDGSGVTSWSTVSATPAGANTQVQFNDAGAFGASANLTWVSPALTIGVAGSTTGQLKLTGATSGTITISGAAAAGTWALTLPTTDGDAGQALITDGSGVTSWASGGSLVAPGLDTQVIFNDSGVFGADAGFVYNKTTDVVTAAGGFRPAANDGGALGASGTAFSDLFLASGGVINWNAGNYTLTHSAGNLTAAGGPFTAPSFIPSSSTIPTDGLYLPAANTLGWAVNSTAEVQLTATALSPATSDGNALGTTALMWADLFLASGGVINWNNGAYTATQASAKLTLSSTTAANTELAIGSSGSLLGEASNTLAIRNSTNAQIFRLYRTFTDASNYERIAISSLAGTGIYNIAMSLMAETAGTGTDDIDIVLNPSGTNGRVELRNGTNPVVFRIYGTDDGAGNAERLSFFYTTNTVTRFVFGSFNNGSGSARDIDLSSVSNIVNIRNFSGLTSAQTLRLYRTFTNDSNYERLALQTGAGYVELAAETAGTGTDNIAVRLTPAGTENVIVNGATGANLVIVSSAPTVSGGSSLGAVVLASTAANNVRIITGSSVPTATAEQGSLYLRSAGGSSNTRAYIALTSTGSWTPILTGA